MNSSKKKQSPKGDTRLVFDMSKYQRRDTVTFDITINDGLEHRYNTAVSLLELFMTVGGTRLRGKGVTFKDNKRPICKFRINGDYSGEDVSMTFIVAKGTIYFEGYSGDDEDNDDFKQPNWSMLKGHSIKLTDCKTPIDSTLDVNYDGSSSLGSRIGPLVLLEALYVLKKNENRRLMQKAFHVVCVHFAEAVRFKSIREAIAASMQEPYVQHSLPSKFIVLILNWNSLSTIMRRYKMDVLQSQEILDKDQGKMKQVLGLDRKAEFTNEHEAKVFNMISVFLVEGDDEREDRRERVRNVPHHKNALRGLPSVPLYKLTRKTLNWFTPEKLMSRQYLHQTRVKLLNQLIRSGGEDDIWACLVRALWKQIKEVAPEGEEEIVRWEEEDEHIGRLILKNTDINFPVDSPFFFTCYDDKGYVYRLPNELLSNPDCQII